MQYWLVKTEPSAWSWDDQRKAGSKGEPWTGVRNHTAKQNLAKMHKGDQAFFYHSVDEKSIVGLVEIKNHQLSWWFDVEPLKAVLKDSATFGMGLWDH